MLTTPRLSDSGLTIVAEYKGRGVGDCGEISDGRGTVAAFKLVLLRGMDECRGVASDDWPTLYKAKATQDRRTP